MNGKPQGAVPPSLALARMLQGNQLQQAIYVAAKLGIADLLSNGPKDSADLAAATDANPEALYRLLRALAGFGVFTEDADRRFALNPMGALLQSGPQFLRSFALWSGGVSYQAFGGLEQSVRTGDPAFETLYGMDFFAYLDHHPESGDVFDEMMSRHTAPVARAVAGYDFAGVGTVVDVGGGRGELVATVLRQHPAMRGVLVDHPRVLERARRVLEAAEVADRCTTVPGDILQSVPSGDGYMLKSVLHGLNDDDAVRVLANCRRAMRPDSVVLLVEFVIPLDDTPFPGKLMDLLMLVGCHGRERTADEFCALLAAAGWRMTNIVPTKHAYSIIEGKPT